MFFVVYSLNNSGMIKSNFLKLFAQTILVNRGPFNLPRVNSNVRHYVSPAKRFYKRANILQSNGKFEIALDQRKLKTPNGKVFFVDSEPLAIAVATEWDAQKEIINRASMHLTSLCNTVIDNPNNIHKLDMVNYLINYIETDTLLFHFSEEERLKELQVKEWSPVIDWFNERYETDLASTDGLLPPIVSPITRMSVSKYLSSHSDAALHGFTYAVDTLKSLVLAFACVDRHLSVERSVLLARLEEEYQLGHWGRVEWAHDMHQQDVQARLAAAVFFIYCNTSSESVKQKVA